MSELVGNGEDRFSHNEAHFPAPVIKFEKNRYTVNEPIIKGDKNILRILVIRLGDTSGMSEVRVSTKSGSARAGRDFNGYSKGWWLV